MLDLIEQKLELLEQPQRRAFSSRYPKLKRPIIAARRALRTFNNYSVLGAPLKKQKFMPAVITRHSSLLYRKLGDTDPALQINKVHNLKLAIEKINGLVIPPSKTFSFWHQVGAADPKNGYVEGLILSNGKPAKGVGGGLCQLSNLLFWLFLHADTQILERHHHSVDAFPDSGRTLPFGSGATIFSNYLDLKIKNISAQPIQIKLWLTETQLKGQLLSTESSVKKFHISEHGHCFVKKGENYFRYNELYRETLTEGRATSKEKILTNFAPVLYPITADYLKQHKYSLVELP